MAYTIPQEILQAWQKPTPQQQYAQQSIKEMEEKRKQGLLNITPTSSISKISKKEETKTQEIKTQQTKTQPSTNILSGGISISGSKKITSTTDKISKIEQKQIAQQYAQQSIKKMEELRKQGLLNITPSNVSSIEKHKIISSTQQIPESYYIVEKAPRTEKGVIYQTIKTGEEIKKINETAFEKIEYFTKIPSFVVISPEKSSPYQRWYPHLPTQEFLAYEKAWEQKPLHERLMFSTAVAIESPLDILFSDVGKREYLIKEKFYKYHTQSPTQYWTETFTRFATENPFVVTATSVGAGAGLAKLAITPKIGGFLATETGQAIQAGAGGFFIGSTTASFIKAESFTERAKIATLSALSAGGFLAGYHSTIQSTWQKYLSRPAIVESHIIVAPKQIEIAGQKYIVGYGKGTAISTLPAGRIVYSEFYGPVFAKQLSGQKFIFTLDNNLIGYVHKPSVFGFGFGTGKNFGKLPTTYIFTERLRSSEISMFWTKTTSTYYAKPVKTKDFFYWGRATTNKLLSGEFIISKHKSILNIKSAEGTISEGFLGKSNFVMKIKTPQQTYIQYLTKGISGEKSFIGKQHVFVLHKPIDKILLKQTSLQPKDLSLTKNIASISKQTSALKQISTTITSNVMKAHTTAIKSIQIPKTHLITTSLISPTKTQIREKIFTFQKSNLLPIEKLESKSIAITKTITTPSQIQIKIPSINIATTAITTTAITTKQKINELLEPTKTFSTTFPFIGGGLIISSPPSLLGIKMPSVSSSDLKPFDFAILPKRLKIAKRKSKKTLLADLLSVTVSQAKFGKATHPKVTKSLWKRAQKSFYLNIPTKELLKRKI